MSTDAVADRLELRGITVDFGATRALHDITLRVPPGQIVGLLGHNGAGKTTLFNVISGVITATSGSFLIDGMAAGHGLTPRDAADLGIAIIHQEPALVPNLSVLDNLLLGSPVRGSRREKRAAALTALEKVGSTTPLDAPVGSLDLGQRQLVDLARGLLAGSMRVLLLDEPTAALGRAETDYLHGLIRSLAQDGVTVVYVSHRLPDILEVCDRVVVLRGGEVVEDDAATTFTPAKLATALVPEIEEHVFEISEPGEETLSVNEPQNVHFESGEVVGLFGMAGGEQFALLRSIAGLSGRYPVTLSGKPTIITSPADAITRGIVHVPADRETDGLISGQTALETVMMPWYSSKGYNPWWVTDSSGLEVYERARADFKISGPGPEAEISQFSGGNRQKHLLARWTHPQQPRILLLAQPTQGVDVGAKVDIVRVVRSAAAAGVTVVVASAESDEIASMCDRAYVIVRDSVSELERDAHFDERLLSALLTLATPHTALSNDSGVTAP